MPYKYAFLYVDQPRAVSKIFEIHAMLSWKPFLLLPIKEMSLVVDTVLNFAITSDSVAMQTYEHQ